MPIWVITKEIKMNEIEQELDDLLDRLEKILTPNDMNLLRYACGKSKQNKEFLREVFVDIGQVFGENKK